LKPAPTGRDANCESCAFSDAPDAGISSSHRESIARVASEHVDWVAASGRARVLSFTVVRRPVSPAFAVDVPYIVALVTLAEGPTMMTNIVGCAPERVTIGMEVVVTFEDWTEDIAITKFQPVR
jgi:uncharacterized OB-fold protein